MLQGALDALGAYLQGYSDLPYKTKSLKYPFDSWHCKYFLGSIISVGVPLDSCRNMADFPDPVWLIIAAVSLKSLRELQVLSCPGYIVGNGKFGIAGTSSGSWVCCSSCDMALNKSLWFDMLLQLIRRVWLVSAIRTPVKPVCSNYAIICNK